MKSFRLTAPLIGALCIAGCGDATSGLFPQIEFDLPDNVSENTSGATALSFSSSKLGLGMGLTQGGGQETRAPDNVISQWAGRVDGIVERTNEFLTKLEEQGVTVGTAVSFTKRQKTLSMLVTEISDDSGFTKQAVVCVDGEIMKHLKWNDDGTQIEMTRNFGVDPLTEKDPADFMAKFSLETDTGGNVQVRVNASGTPFKVPRDHREANETYLNERIQIEKSSDGTFALGGVQRFSATAPTSFAANEGDAYFVGKILTDGSSSAVGWRSAKASCTTAVASFSETNPAFCATASIATAGTFVFTVDTAAAATAYANGLDEIDLPSSAELEEVEFDSSITCPESSSS